MMERCCAATSSGGGPATVPRLKPAAASNGAAESDQNFKFIALAEGGLL
jgi:hypothetical protein